MNFLYGDSTSSPLKSNFLEFLRDALDFSVFALQADDRIEQGKQRIRALTVAAEAEQARLDRFVGAVSRAIDEGEKGASESPTTQCAARLTSLVADAQQATTGKIRQQLAEAITQVNAEEAASRVACTSALTTLLAPHDVHDATSDVHLSLGSGGIYDAKLNAQATFGLEWTFALDVPEGHLWRAPVRVDTVAPHLEIRAPQLTGWLSKEVKIRPQKLERHVVTDLRDDKMTIEVKLRTEPSVAAGFDLEVDRTTGRVKMTRLGPEGDASTGPFDVHADDAPALVALAEKLCASASELKRGALLAATFEGADFTAVPAFGALVDRFVEATAPIVREIAERSLTPNELVIRRALANDRREEIFVSKATLREKYAALPAPLAKVFAPLGLERTERPKTTPPAPSADELPPVRAQLAPSRPPPPPAPPPRVPTARPPASSTAAAPPPAAPPAGSADARGPVLSEQAIDISQDDLVSTLPDVPEPRATGPEPGAGTPRNEALASALKKIATLVRSGRVDEAYEEYATLYSGPAFADHRPEDQRLALRQMVLATPPPAKKTDPVLAACGAAIARLDTLTSALEEPADYELLGDACALAGDPRAATAAFRRGLERERERNPESDLCARLMTRLSAL